ncbi:Probable RNA-directed DNA polymerase from transposon BS [Eumeta japonica]|uniref:Probable RNA-directed DNA polymerase from transposon BS n=1 Tax=Eumeta variegata TaxID=151549 RepID=A0A4C1ZH04_EUMVA|nr:Probable RNA-directed DNA polymerase from transposon BS [Eumeta japonica]
MSSIDDFRKLNSYLIKNGITFHTYALEEERKVKAVIKGVPVEIETKDIKPDLERQEYPVQAVHRMHRRDGTALGLVLVILNKTDGATDIFKNLVNVCGLFGITVEAPYKRGIPGQCHRCQLYGHAATNCHAPPRCVKCLDPHWTKECTCTRDSEGKPACCNCGSNHTANYGGCPAAPKPKPKNSSKKHYKSSTDITLDVSHFPALNSGNKQTARTVPAKPTGSKNFQHHHPPTPRENQWKKPLPWVNSKTTGTENRVPHKQPTRQAGTATSAASALGDDIGIIMSILQVVRSAEVADLAAKFRKAKHGVDRLKIILENQELINRQGAPKGGTALYYRQTLGCSPIDIPLLINLEATGCRLAISSHDAIVIVSVYLPPRKKLLRSDVETLLALGDVVILFGDLNSKSTQWRCDYTNANGHIMIDLAKDLHYDVIAPPTQTYFPDNIRNRPDILDIALMRGVALNVRCIETLQSLNSDHRPVFLRVGPPDGEQPSKKKIIISWRKVNSKTKNGAPSWDIIPSHHAYWKLAKALKSDGYLPTPDLRKPDNSFAVDDREKAECLADIKEQQCSNNSIHDAAHSHRIEEEVRTKISLEPKDDLAPVSVDEIQKHIKVLKTKKAPGFDSISNKALKCFSLSLMALLVAIFNACFKNCYFPPIWKEAVVIGLPKPVKPRDLPASYRPISLLNGLGKLREKTIKTRLNEHLIGKDLIINEQFGFRLNHSCPQQVHRLVEHISEGFKKKRKTVAVFFDVAKAFDRVWHAGLIHKLYTLELPDRLVLIIQNYLRNRKFTFRHENTYPTERTLKAGVPQGSTLSPLLYSAYVNDIPRPSNGVQLALFADDIALYLRGSNFRDTTPQLQRAIDELT